MSVTITDRPNDLTVKGQRLIYVCTSTNTGQTGFKYIVVIKDESGTQIPGGKFYVSKNSNDALIFDIREAIQEDIKCDTVDSQQSDGIIHNMPHAADQMHTVAATGCKKYTVEFGEVYGDPLVEQAATATDEVYLTDGYLQVRDGYQNPMTEFNSENSGTTSPVTKGFLIERGESLHRQSGITGFVIPTNDNEYGVVGLRYDSTGLFPSEADHYEYAIYDSSGTIVLSEQYVDFYAAQGGAATASTTAKDKLLYSAMYPANLSKSDSHILSALRPANVSNWSYYTIRLWDDTGGVPGFKDCSKYLIFVNTCPPAKHQNVQVGWANSVGGWEYMSFVDRSQRMIKTTSKNYQKTVGDYSGTSFSFSTFDRQTTPYHVQAEHEYTLAKTGATYIETQLMQSLLKSKNVMVSFESGTWLPVASTSGAAKYEEGPQSGQAYRIELKVKLAQREEC